jgi:hypothetical protein
MKETYFSRLEASYTIPVATLNTVADHLSVLLFLCLIFHNLQLAGASSSGMVAVAAKQKGVTFHAVWLGK